MILREKHKMRTIKAEITNVLFSGGLNRSSDESSVMEVEQRVRVVRLRRTNNHIYGRINFA